MIIQGDCLEQLKLLEANSVDSVVTDPPYGLAFMNKHWDYDVPSVDVWREVIRVLKPGGYLLSFGGTRTYHRMVVAIEDAGFEIRDQLQWIYGSGFPKSMDISKAIDKAAGAEREVVGIKEYAGGHVQNSVESIGYGGNKKGADKRLVTAPSADLAKQWSGWGTALKPANEPIVLARKPLSEKTVAKNVERWGVGGLNIDGCRIGTEIIQQHQRDLSQAHGNKWAAGTKQPVLGKTNTTIGRWPANVIFDELAGGILGEPSRFFYCAKASKSERNAGLEGMPDKILARSGGAQAAMNRGEEYDNGDSSFNKTIKTQNFHPTVKPLKLMQYLVRLVTPANGTVLDPYCGSGTTGLAAKLEGFSFIGIEREAEYVEIAERRIENGR